MSEKLPTFLGLYALVTKAELLTSGLPGSAVKPLPLGMGI